MTLLHNLILSKIFGGSGGGGGVDSSVAVYVPYAELTNTKIETLIAEGKTPYTIWTKTDGSGEQIVYYFAFRESATMHYFVGWDSVTTFSTYYRNMSVLVAADNGSGQTTRVRYKIDIPTQQNLNDTLNEYVTKTELDYALGKVELPMTYFPDTNTVTLDLTAQGGIAGFATNYYGGVNFMFTLPMVNIDQNLAGSLSFIPSGAYSGNDPTQVFLSLMAVYDTTLYSMVLRPRDANVLAGELKRISGT